MRRSSDSIGALASALAKAQAELTNPEKSLVATLPAERGQQQRSFRYAPLSGGLDIVRKTLGRHEIATIQATAVNRDTGTIQLTTTLAHASGEWIASDWPVCPLADLSTPHRMGAALTYARRYALFTLVGIAGEDDLDAPELPSQVKRPAPVLMQSPSAPTIPQKNGRRNPPTRVTLNVEASSHQRDALLAELALLTTLDDAATWAKRILAIKNTMQVEQADEIERALEAKLVQLDRPPKSAAEPSTNDAIEQTATAGEAADGTGPNETASPFRHVPRRRDKTHLRFVASQPCLLCGRRPSDPHHLRFAQAPALGRKVSDEFTVPLCRTHHRQLHRSGNEARWWEAVDAYVDPLEVAKGLWESTRSGSFARPATPPNMASST